MNGTQVAVAIVGALGLIAAALIGGLFARRKVGAEASNQISQAYGGLTDDLRQSVTDLKEDVAGLKTAHDSLKTEHDDLKDAHGRTVLDLEHERHQRRLSNQYARDLVADLRAEGMTVRPAPAGLELD